MSVGFQEEGTQVKEVILNPTGVKQMATWNDIKCWINNMSENERIQQAIITDQGQYHCYEICESMMYMPGNCGFMHSLVLKEHDA